MPFENQSNSPSVAARALEYHGLSSAERSTRRTRQKWIWGGVLALVAYVGLVVVIRGVAISGSTRHPKIMSAQADIFAIGTQLRAYEVTNERFPTTAQGLVPLVQFKLLDKVPLDPWGNPYIYHCPGRNGADSFDLYSAGPNGQDDYGAGDDIVVH